MSKNRINYETLEKYINRYETLETLVNKENIYKIKKDISENILEEIPEESIKRQKNMIVLNISKNKIKMISNDVNRKNNK